MGEVVQISGLTGVRVPGDRGAGALASALALRLPQGLDGTGPATPSASGPRPST
jgi:hypothetical protein